MILQFVNKQRRFSAKQIEACQKLCHKAFELVLSQKFIDPALQDKNLILTATCSFVSKDHIKKANSSFRNIAKVTDVLSFPLLDMEEGRLLQPLQAADFIPRPDEKRELPLGDVLISLEIAAYQAELYGHSFEREVAFLATHASLHLVGFDHQEENEEKKMFSEQEKILDQMGLSQEEQPLNPDQAQGLGEELAHTGFVAIIGRPNVGKSTLLNKISGMKLAIVSQKPQTTRKNARAIYNAPDVQIIFVDTPGIHRPHSSLGEYMVDAAFRAGQSADMLLVMADATKGLPSPVEEEICRKAKESNQKAILVLNKADAVTKEELLPLIQAYYGLYAFAAIIPVSARTGDGVDILLTEISQLLPKGPRLFAEEEFTDQSERTLAAELIREQILRYTNEEIPHGTAVEIVLFEEKLKPGAEDDYDRDLVKITASILCEKTSHRAILLGKQGQMIKRIGTGARENIEKMCGCKVYLDLHVKVRADWKNKQTFLHDLGYRKED